MTRPTDPRRPGPPPGSGGGRSGRSDDGAPADDPELELEDWYLLEAGAAHPVRRPPAPPRAGTGATARPSVPAGEPAAGDDDWYRLEPGTPPPPPDPAAPAGAARHPHGVAGDPRSAADPHGAAGDPHAGDRHGAAGGGRPPSDQPAAAPPPGPVAHEPGSPGSDRTRLLGGRFEVGALIGQGGMADVYRAVDTRSGAAVAVKVLRAPDPADARRLAQEAKALERLRHPGLVRLLATGVADGRAYLVMDLVEGPTLGRLAAPGPVPPARVARIGREVADALAYVHAHGIVHRDVKPGNILLDADGRPRLADFGIASLADASVLTATGTTLGTAAYMAPEQLEHHQVSPAADVWALAMVLLECLLGRRVYTGRPMEVVARRLAGPVPLPAQLPAPWRALLSTMFDHDPGRRPSAGAVHDLMVDPGLRARWVPPPPDQALVGPVAGTSTPAAPVPPGHDLAALRRTATGELPPTAAVPAAEAPTAVAPTTTATARSTAAPTAPAPPAAGSGLPAWRRPAGLAAAALAAVAVIVLAAVLVGGSGPGPADSGSVPGTAGSIPVPTTGTPSTTTTTTTTTTVPPTTTTTVPPTTTTTAPAPTTPAPTTPPVTTPTPPVGPGGAGPPGGR